MKTRSLISSLVLVLSLAVAPGLRAVVAVQNDARPGDDSGYSQYTDNNGNKTIGALTGTITITFDDGSGKAPITLQAGTGTVLDAQGNQVKDANGNAVRPLAALLADPNFVLAVQDTIKAVAAKVAAGGDSAAINNATTQLAALIKAVSAAAPDQASTFVAAAVDTLTKDGGNSVSVQNAITATVAAATNNPAVNSTLVANAVNTAATANHVTYSAPTTTAQVQSVLNQVLTTTPTPIDVSVISRSK